MPPTDFTVQPRWLFIYRRLVMKMPPDIDVSARPRFDVMTLLSQIHDTMTTRISRAQGEDVALSMPAFAAMRAPRYCKIPL